MLDSGLPPEPADVVYERGFPANFATLVLSGKLSVKAGVDGFRAEAGPWTLLGAGALRDVNFAPDFSAHVATDACQMRLPVPRGKVERASSCPRERSEAVAVARTAAVT